MNLGRKKCLLFAVLILAVAVENAVTQSASSAGPAQQKKEIPPDTSPTAAMRASIAEQVAGTWRLVSYQEKTPDGTVVNPFGETPQGIVIFEPGGYVSLQIMKIPRVSFPAGYERATAEQVKAVHEAYLAYYGSWTVDETHSVILENIRASNQPYLNNQMTTQHFELDGKRLNLRTEFDNQGEARSVLFVWEKIH